MSKSRCCFHIERPQKVLPMEGLQLPRLQLDCWKATRHGSTSRFTTSARSRGIYAGGTVTKWKYNHADTNTEHRYDGNYFAINNTGIFKSSLEHTTKYSTSFTPAAYYRTTSASWRAGSTHTATVRLEIRYIFFLRTKALKKRSMYF